MCAASDKRAAHDTDASASCEEKQGRRDRRGNCRRQADVPAAVDGAQHIASLYQMLVCGVHVLGGYETLHDVSEENAHTEARDARCPHVSELKQSIYQVMTTEMCTPGWAKDARVPDSEARVSDSDVVLFPQKHPCLPTVCAAHVPSGFLCVDDRKRDDNKLFKRKNPQHCRGAVGTSTRAVACALASKPQTHPPVLSFVRLEVATICSWICDTGTARIRCTKSTCNVQQLWELLASDVVVSTQQSQSNCLLVTEISTAHTPRPHVSCESSKARLSWACHRRRSAT